MAADPNRKETRNQVGKTLLRARQCRLQTEQMRDQTADPVMMFNRFRRYLGESIVHAREHMAKRVIVASQPCFAKEHYSAEELASFWNGSIGDIYRGEPTGFYTATLISNLMRELRENTKSVAAEAAVEFVDLSSDVIHNDCEHYYDQFHFTPKGAEVVGELLARAIVFGMKAAYSAANGISRGP